MASSVSDGLGLHTATWSDSDAVCCFVNGERYLGHIVRAADNWLAFDATHLDESGSGFCLLGCCATMAFAKYLVEQSFRRDRARERLAIF